MGRDGERQGFKSGVDVAFSLCCDVGGVWGKALRGGGVLGELHWLVDGERAEEQEAPKTSVLRSLTASVSLRSTTLHSRSCVYINIREKERGVAIPVALVFATVVQLRRSLCILKSGSVAADAPAVLHLLPGGQTKRFGA